MKLPYRPVCRSVSFIKGGNFHLHFPIGSLIYFLNVNSKKSGHVCCNHLVSPFNQWFGAKAIFFYVQAESETEQICLVPKHCLVPCGLVGLTWSLLCGQTKKKLNIPLIVQSTSSQSIAQCSFIYIIHMRYTQTIIKAMTWEGTIEFDKSIPYFIKCASQ